MALGPRIAAGVLLVEAVGVVLVVVAAAADHSILLPVVTNGRLIAQVDVGFAVVVPLVLGAAGQLLSGQLLRWVQRSLSLSIVMFLLAQLNGIRELGTLVAIYALTSATVLFAVLHERLPERTTGRLPAIFGAMVGIVPWGLIAWYQITALVGVGGVGGGPAVWVRILTVAMLALVAAGVVLRWRRLAESRAALVLSVLTPSVMAVTVALVLTRS